MSNHNENEKQSIHIYIPYLKLLNNTKCCYVFDQRIVNNLLRVDDVKVVTTTYCESVLLLTLLHDNNDLFQTCRKLGTTSC